MVDMGALVILYMRILDRTRPPIYGNEHKENTLLLEYMILSYEDIYRLLLEFEAHFNYGSFLARLLTNSFLMHLLMHHTYLLKE